jgi:hypothetical protein
VNAVLLTLLVTSFHLCVVVVVTVRVVDLIQLTNCVFGGAAVVEQWAYSEELAFPLAVPAGTRVRH